MLVITRHRLPGTSESVRGDEADVAFPFGTEHPAVAQAQGCLEVLGQRPGFIRGWVARAADEPDLVLLATEWADVGSWRRALSPVDVRVAVLPFLGTAIDEPTAFVVEHVHGDGGVSDASPEQTEEGQ